MDTKDWIALIGPTAIGLFCWLSKRLFARYEQAMEDADQARQEKADHELLKIRETIAGLHSDLARERRERETMLTAVGKWAQNLKSEFSAQLHLHSGDVDELRHTLHTLVAFFNISKDRTRSHAVEISDGVFLVTKQHEEKK